ncbi:MAG: hypothetical protein HY699_03950 [Deltaproteobacteria bacterium]|nr:hypothetical protein [Deltaproteobacteria bacterium]
MRLTRSTLALSLLAVIAVLAVALRPAAQETEEPGSSKVADSELQTFIAVYSAMQMDHDLTIERAVEPYHMSVDAFRQLERRVQAEQRLVDKARQALLVQAQGRAVLGEAPTPTPSPTPTAVPPPRRQHTRKR